MGFRGEQLTTASGVDTGAGKQRVRISQTEGREGGGAVLLYPSFPVDAAPGRLDAGADEFGPTTILASPPNVAGRSSAITVRGVDVGNEGIVLGTPGEVFMATASEAFARIASRAYVDARVDFVNAQVAVTPATGWNRLGLTAYREGSRIFLDRWMQNVNAFTPAGGEVIATLPVGMEPAVARLLAVPVSVGNTVIQVDARPNGQLVIARPHNAVIGANAVWSFDSANWRAA